MGSCTGGLWPGLAGRNGYDPGVTTTRTVELEETGERFEVPPGRTVLAAALAAGIPMASSCRNGTCRTCIRRLASGEVRYVIDWPGLLPEEKLQGFFLPCVAEPATDLVIAGSAPRAWWEVGTPA